MPAAKDTPPAEVPNPTPIPAPAKEGTFQYDGGPTDPIPMPPVDVKPIRAVPDAEALRVSMPVKIVSLEYPAYSVAWASLTIESDFR